MAIRTLCRAWIPALYEILHHRGGACDYMYNTTELTGSLTTTGGMCSPYTGGGTASYSGTTTACDNLNPSTVSCSSPTGGSNGSASYLWEKSTDNGSTWVSTSGVLSTVNPANLTTTTLFRRGASYCTTASENASQYCRQIEGKGPL